MNIRQIFMLVLDDLLLCYSITALRGKTEENALWHLVNIVNALDR